MEGQIFIKGEIGEQVHLVDIISQVEKQKEATMFNVYINSVGGSVDVGFDIYNYLRSLNVPINTIGQEMVASIATVIFMAGSVRSLDAGTEFMIHLPSGSVSGTVEEIEAYNDMLKRYEKKLVDFYKEATGLNDEAIKPLLKYETWLSANLAQDFRFTTKKAEGVPVLAKANFNFKNVNMTNLSNEDKSWIEKKFEAINSLFKSNVKNIVLQDANGVEVNFPDVMDGESPIIGESIATVDGQTAEGEYLMPDGQTFVFSAGVLTEVKEAEADASAEKIAELEKQLADAKAEAMANATIVEEKEQVIAKFEKEFKALKSEIKSKFDGVDPKNKKDESTTGTSYKELVLKAKNKKKIIWQV